MSHSIEYYQRMNTEQLIHEMHHARWTVDRERAAQVYKERIAAQKAKEAARSKDRSDALDSRVTSLQRTVDTLAHRNADLSRVISQQNDKLRSMQQDHSRQVAAMRADYNHRIEQVSNENRNALHELQVQMVNEDAKLRAAINDNFRRTTDMISAVNDQLTHRIEAVHHELSTQLEAHQRQINDLEASFQALRHDDAQLRQNAQEYLEAALALINSTIEYNNENYHSWRSEDLAALIKARTNIESDLNSGMLTVGVARSNARTLFEDALRYRANVYADEREWQLRHAAAQQCIDAAFNDLMISRVIHADGMEIDVDYWTCGDLRRIGEKLQELELLLENPNLTNAELTGISELAETYRQEIQTAVAFAMQARQCSYDRHDLVQIAIDHIQTDMPGLNPEWQEYFAGDDRLGYRVYLTSPATGARIVLTAEPAQDGTDLRNQFRFDILDRGHLIHNAQDAQTFMNALAAALSKVPGCEFTNPNCSNQDAPTADHGQGNDLVWRRPSEDDQAAARSHAAPVHAPHKPLPRPQPVGAFTPQSQI